MSRATRRLVSGALRHAPLAVAALLASSAARAETVLCSPSWVEPITPHDTVRVVTVPSSIPSFYLGSTVDGAAPDVRLFDVSADPPAEVALRIEAHERYGVALLPSIAVASGGGVDDVRSLLVPGHSYQFEYMRRCGGPELEKGVQKFTAGPPAPFARTAGTLKAGKPRIAQDYDRDGAGFRHYHYDLTFEPSPEMAPWLDSYEVFMVGDGARPAAPSGYRLRDFIDDLQIALCPDDPSTLGPDGRMHHSLELIARPMGLEGPEVATNAIEFDLDCARPAPWPIAEGFSGGDEYSNPPPATTVHEDGCSLAAPGRAARGTLALTAVASAAAFAAGARRRRVRRGGSGGAAVRHATAPRAAAPIG
jgi:hypothetical protein